MYRNYNPREMSVGSSQVLLADLSYYFRVSRPRSCSNSKVYINTGPLV